MPIVNFVNSTTKATTMVGSESFGNLQFVYQKLCDPFSVKTLQTSSGTINYKMKPSNKQIPRDDDFESEDDDTSSQDEDDSPESNDSIDLRPGGNYTGDNREPHAPRGPKKIVNYHGRALAIPTSAGPNGYIHADFIRRELEMILTEEEMNKYSIVQKEDENVERLFEIANEVILAERTALHYSNFHTYNAFRDIDTPEQARQAVKKADGAWRQMPPYANCLGMASACCSALRKRLRCLSRLKRYAYRVELVTDSWRQATTHDLAYHCICIIRLDQSCIILDPVSHRGAQRVYLNQIGGYSVDRNIPRGMRWAYVPGPRNARLLVEYAPLYPELALPRPVTGDLPEALAISYSDPFAIIKGGLAGGVINLTYPSSGRRYASKHGRFPSRRTINMMSIWDRQPSFKSIYSVATKSKSPEFLVSTATLRVNFGPRRSLVMERIPCADWLARPENRHLLEDLIAYTSPVSTNDWISKRFATCEVRFRNWSRLIEKGFTARERRGIRLLDAISGGLDQPNGEVKKIANVMLSVWRAQAAASVDVMV
ncbi:hypothetical protein IAQ61_011216, partial [Plenodomus lingam]|uniref:uncharacterized protein n=1 Tax=Leptosphaeria maculans TaxID=5022 RepID=UPI00332A543F